MPSPTTATGSLQIDLPAVLKQICSAPASTSVSIETP